MTAPAKGTAARLWRLARPRGAIWVALLPLLGFAWGHWDRALLLSGGLEILWVLVAWLSLHAGTMWLNAALDRDEGDVLFGDAVAVPDAAVPASYLALAVSVVLAALAGPVPALCALGCAVLAVLYSHPRTVWKAHPVGGPFVNMVGYALLSPIAGWWLVDVSANPRTWLMLALLVPWLLGCYFAAQVFQREEDASRGYRTLVVTHGSVTTARAARLALGVSAAGFFGLAAAGWFPRVALAGLPVYLWADHWLAGAARGAVLSNGWGDQLFRRLLIFAWAVIAAVSVEYFVDSKADRPVAGLSTVAGLPSDRPVLPPSLMRRWEYKNGNRTE